MARSSALGDEKVVDLRRLCRRSRGTGDCPTSCRRVAGTARSTLHVSRRNSSRRAWVCVALPTRSGVALSGGRVVTRSRVPMIGRRFGRLSVLACVRADRWRCACTCGTEHEAEGGHLRAGRIQSCGCKRRIERADPSPPPVRGAVWVALGHGYFTLIDKADAAQVTARVWHRDASGYARSRGVRLHRMLLPHATFVDHIDGDKLNNRRANLRACTPKQSARNTCARGRSGYKGVSHFAPTNKWRARIRVDGETHYLGHYASAEDAAHAYDAAARRLHGEYARLNFP